jgi:hypothetical protein
VVPKTAEMSDRMSEFSSQAGLGIYCAHPHKCPDSEEVTHPVTVRINVGHFKPTKYDDKEARAEHNYQVLYRWTDPRLADWPETAELPADLWVPPLAVWGNSSDSDREKMKGGWKQQGTLGLTATGKKRGELVMFRDFRYETVDCRSSADLHRFPFDSHVQRMTCSLGVDIYGSSKYVRWDPVDGPASLANQNNHNGKMLEKIFQADEWRVSSIVWGYAQHSSPSTGAVYHDFVVQVLRQRSAGFYLVKALYPTALCALLSLSALVIPAEELANRLTVVLSVFLTVFAIQWVTTDRLPHTSFLTTLDKIIITTVLFIVVIGLVSMCLKGALRVGVDAETIERHELYHFVFFTSLFALYSLNQAVAIARRGSSGCPADIGVSPWDGAVWQADVDTTTGELGEPRALKMSDSSSVRKSWTRSDGSSLAISPDEYLPSAAVSKVDNPTAAAGGGAAAVGPRQAAIERNFDS